MNLAALSIEKRAITYFGILLVVAGGVFSYLQLGQLEDPEFSVKTAAITVTYPGASAEEVELEVTDRIETKLQEMVELKNVYSNSRPGLSTSRANTGRIGCRRFGTCSARRSPTSSPHFRPARGSR
jgi:multidrug efflux pump subunit AcrB